MSNWSSSDLAALEKAIAQGARSVQYSDKKVTYGSLDEMMRIRTMIRTELGLNTKNVNRTYAKYSRGF